MTSLCLHPIPSPSGPTSVHYRGSCLVPRPPHRLRLMWWSKRGRQAARAACAPGPESRGSVPVLALPFLCGLGQTTSYPVFMPHKKERVIVPSSSDEIVWVKLLACNLAHCVHPPLLPVPTGGFSGAHPPRKLNPGYCPLSLIHLPVWHLNVAGEKCPCCPVSLDVLTQRLHGPSEPPAALRCQRPPPPHAQTMALLPASVKE